MNEVLVSVIIPFYNSQDFIHECLDSIIGQSYHNIEIICVDDGSTDNTKEILESYRSRDNRFQLIYKVHTGMGAAEARNAGIIQAKGKYLVILDSDDFFDKDLIRLTVEKAENSNADIVLYDAFYYDNLSHSLKDVTEILNKTYLPEKEVFSRNDIPKHIFQLNIGAAWSCIFKKELIEKNNLRFQSVYHADDLLFTYSALALAERITVLNKRLLYYRMNNLQSQTANKTISPTSAFQANYALKKVLLENGIYDELEQSFVNMAVKYNYWYLDTMQTYDVFEELYYMYQNEYLDKLGITGHDEDFFYLKTMHQWCDKVKTNSVNEYLFYLLKGEGFGQYTYSTNYVFPVNKGLKNKKIILYGAGNVGRAYYIQMLYSRYCNIVLWVDANYKVLENIVKDPLEVKDTEYDHVLIAIEDVNTAKVVEKYLLGLGVSREKIIQMEHLT
jgi:Glycosyltransferases, probably involved in cell wall biogenesis